MSDFDYGNARLHAMKSRLFTRQTLEELSGSGSVRGLTNALTKTTYREVVEMALVQFSGLEALNRAMQDDLVNTISRIDRFYQGQAAELVGWVVGRYDVDNVKTILRGLTGHLPADEILAGTVPAGRLHAADLAQLTRMENARAAIDLLATWRLPLAQSLVILRTERPGADLLQMELALEQWFYRAAMTGVNGDKSAALRRFLRMRADIENILTALRLVGVGEAAAFLRQHFKAEDAGPLFVGPGSIPQPLLSQVAVQPTIRRAIMKLEGTAYYPALSQALGQYAGDERLTLFEDALARQQLRQARLLFLGDPLGIGVVIGYIALKTAEMRNLHRIAQGLELGETPGQIQADLTLEDAI